MTRLSLTDVRSGDRLALADGLMYEIASIQSGTRNYRSRTGSYEDCKVFTLYNRLNHNTIQVCYTIDGRVFDMPESPYRIVYIDGALGISDHSQYAPTPADQYFTTGYDVPTSLPQGTTPVKKKTTTKKTAPVKLKRSMVKVNVSFSVQAKDGDDYKAILKMLADNMEAAVRSRTGRELHGFKVTNKVYDEVLTVSEDDAN